MAIPLVDLSKMEKAVASLRGALFPPPANDRERDGAIQRFEYTFELSWKSAKRVLEKNGISTQTPREVIRKLAQMGWIDNPEAWFQFLESRNLTSHVYQENIANEVFQQAQKFLIETEKLLAILKAKSNG